jgi:hypothetical protein
VDSVKGSLEAKGWQAFISDALLRSSSFAEDDAMRGEAAKLATGNDRLSPVEQLDIYREQYWLRHLASLEEDFATLVYWYGSHDFRAIATEYLEAYPSKSYTLRDLGNSFAIFLSEREPYRSDPFLADCAKTELAFIDAFDAADAPPLDTSALATATEDAWSNARIVLHPSVQRVRLAFPIDAYRAAVKAKEDPARPDAKATHLVVYRGTEMLHYIAIDALAFALLDAIAAGEPLAAACEKVAREAGVTDASELETKVGAWFQQWASYGWIAAVNV